MTNLDLSEAPRTEDGPDQLAWQMCTDLETACELTAEWLEGKRHYQPGYMAAQPASETGPISLQLAAINRLGLLTSDSQPGEALTEGSGQRAYVTGYCSENTAALVSAVLTVTDIVALWGPPGAPGSMQVCVSLDGYEEFSHLGRRGSREDTFEEYRYEANETLAAIIADAWELHIFDPVWGRSDYLLPRLKLALEAAAEA
ncbi:hypothetical protein AU252_20300 [Pseudarthrobacter sulfonivorans]|uniref:DUF6919 domain-containing protein n=1 Tax=Pseudarthrobacter sulfonivorans TaxID=121292 RepID=A0A0U3R244_9MICC|nr:hypothetical protein [Pseudarthrobacter sulfonivorans]ALV43212.1 hypothetical protein AU252_20300 [Pseudarthrobacter sulfonivorans]